MKIVTGILLTILFSSIVFTIGVGFSQTNHKEAPETLCDWMESHICDDIPQSVINRPGVLTVKTEPERWQQQQVPIRLTKQYLPGRWVLTYVDVSKYDPTWKARPCLLQLGYREKTVNVKTVKIVPKPYNGCWIYTQIIE